MKTEHKELLLKDLCARLPYGVKAYVKNWSKMDRKWYEGIYTIKSVFPSLNEIHVQSENCSVDVILGYSDFDIKPYLFPLSSMTEEQDKEFALLQTSAGKEGFLYAWNCANMMEWLIENHFDYNGLIEKGLAIDATGLNIY